MNDTDEIIALGVSRRVASEIGARLREGRERSTRSMSEIATHIKVREHYLHAIEDGNWNLLPAGMNGRGFVRIYAKELRVAVPEIEPRLASSNTDDTEKSAVKTSRAGEHAAVPTPNNVQMQKSFNRANTPNTLRPKNPPQQTRAHHHEEDDADAIDAEGEMAELLGIDSSHYKPRVMPPMQREVMYDNNIPVVNADSLAQEMFLGDTTPDAIHNHSVEQEAAPITPAAETFASVAPTSAPISEAPISNPHYNKHDKKHKRKHHRDDSNDKGRESASNPAKTQFEHRPILESPIPEAISEGHFEALSQQESAVQQEIISQENATNFSESTSAQNASKEAVNYPNAEVSTPATKKASSGFSIWRGVIAGSIALIAAATFVVISNSRDTQNKDDEIDASVAQTEENIEPAAIVTAAPSVTQATTTDIAATPGAATPAATPSSANASENPQAPATTNTASNTAPPVPTAAPITANKATLKFIDKVSVNIRLDGKQFFSGTRDAGDLEINFSQYAEIYTDDASKVSLEYAGWENHGALGWPGRKRRVLINAIGYTGTGKGTL